MLRLCWPAAPTPAASAPAAVVLPDWRPSPLPRAETRRCVLDLPALTSACCCLPLMQGHVLIFGFIQRYFPGLFPSQFTGRRQDLMMK